MTKSLLEEIKIIIAESRRHTLKVINRTLLNTYWQIAKLIVEDEQKGDTRAE